MAYNNFVFRDDRFAPEKIEEFGRDAPINLLNLSLLNELINAEPLVLSPEVESYLKELQSKEDQPVNYFAFRKRKGEPIFHAINRANNAINLYRTHFN